MLDDVPGSGMPRSPELTLYPNPITSFNANRVFVQGILEKPASVKQGRFKSPSELMRWKPGSTLYS